MRLRRYAIAAAAVIVLAWSAFAIAQGMVEREARVMLDDWVKSPPEPFTEFKYGDVRFDLAQRRLNIDNLELSGHPSGLRITIESVGIVDPQPFALDNVINSARYKDGKGQGDFVQVASQAQVRNIKFEQGGNEATIAAIGIGAVSLRQFAVAPTEENLDSPGKAIGIIAPGIRVGEFVINNLHSQKAGSSEGVRIARVTLRGLDAGRLAEFRIDDFRAIDEGKDVVTIGSVLLAGTDVTRMLPDLAAGRPISTTDPARRPLFDRWEIVALGGSALADHGFSLARVGADSTRSADGKIDRGTFRAEGLQLSAPTKADSPVVQALAGLGYPALKGEIACSGDWDWARKSYRVEPCTFAIPGAGTLSFTMSLSNLDFSSLTGIPGMDDTAALMQAMQAAKFEWIRIAYKDEGLTDRVIALAAKSQGQPEAAFRQAMVGQIKAGGGAYGAGSPRLQALVDAVAAFLTRPGTLTVALEPSAPVAFGSLGGNLIADPNAAAERVGLTGKHSQ
jgi:hypothetical protein